MLGVTGFVIGFIGPIWCHPGANQGPMLGIFITAPAGVVLGGPVGGALRIARPECRTEWRLWTLNAATAVYGFFVLYLVLQPVL